MDEKELTAAEAAEDNTPEPGEAPVEEPPTVEPPASDPEPGEPGEGDPPSKDAPVEEPEGEFASSDVSADDTMVYSPKESIDAEALLGSTPQAPTEEEQNALKALLEAVVYITDEPLSAQQIAQAISRPLDQVQRALDALSADYAESGRGLTIREVAGGYKMGTKPEYHEELRSFVKNLKPPLKLSLAALETLAVIAYKQPITGPEIQDIRGVQGTSALKTLLDRKLIAVAGRKNVIGKPMLYKTTKEFMIQFGLKDLTELPTLKEFEELGRMAFGEPEPEPEPQESEQAEAASAGAEQPATPETPAETETAAEGEKQEPNA
jgi:segregation and condensation protein B